MSSIVSGSCYNIAVVKQKPLITRSQYPLRTMSHHEPSE